MRNADRSQRCVKVKYPSRRKALDALSALWVKLNTSYLRAYRCGKHTSETWHLTSHTPSGRRTR